MVDGANIVGDRHNRVAILFGRVIADAKMDGNGWHDCVWELIERLFFAEVQHMDDFVVVFCEIHVGLEISVQTDAEVGIIIELGVDRGVKLEADFFHGALDNGAVVDRQQ